ncbi:hypothetical protein CCC_00866 [Paramagnetospirillum magnetotacticum MS-1]|uniref:Uncharacterized protein n=1 Tax=Paramagnetospirillum magnetotacticum MS-1 TaxID=272627 RepID=A0A0C2YSV7_PARME|nr:hypothetical protein CCC_00866 [Paramagnetospirillum magnetotacticum MS-1]
MAVIVAAVIGSGVLLALRSERLTLEGALCACAALIVAVLPMAARLAEDRPGPLPILPLAALFYVPFFILPPLLLDVTWPNGQPIRLYSDAPELEFIGAGTTGTILAGLIMLVAGMALSRRFRPVDAVRLPTSSPRRLAMIAYGAMAVHAVLLLYPPLAGAASVGQLLRPTGLLAGSLAVAAMVSGGFSRLEIVLILLVLLPARLVAGLATGSLNNSLILVACIALVLAALRRRAILPMLAVVAVAACLYTPMQYFRMVTWGPKSESLNLRDKVAAFAEGFSRNQFQPGGLWGAATSNAQWHPYSNTLGQLVWPLLKRVDQASILAVVVQRTPGEIPSWDGHSLKHLPLASVPRALWRDKPEERFGNEFGRRYQILQPGDTTMSVNLPWLTELYANFLMPGVVVGMFLVGLGLGLIEISLNRPDARPAEVALCATLLVPLLVPESNITLMIGNLPTMGLVLWGGLRLGLWGGSASFIDKSAKIQ